MDNSNPKNLAISSFWCPRVFSSKTHFTPAISAPGPDLSELGTLFLNGLLNTTKSRLIGGC